MYVTYKYIVCVNYRAWKLFRFPLALNVFMEFSFWDSLCTFGHFYSCYSVTKCSARCFLTIVQLVSTWPPSPPVGGGCKRDTPFKYVTGQDVRTGPFSNPLLYWMTPFLFFTFCSHLMTKMFSLTMTYNLRNNKFFPYFQKCL